MIVIIGRFLRGSRIPCPGCLSQLGRSYSAPRRSLVFLGVPREPSTSEVRNMYDILCGMS